MTSCTAYTHVPSPCTCTLGSLGVPGAVEDSQRTADFVNKHINEIDEIYVSLDTHHVSKCGCLPSHFEYIMHFIVSLYLYILRVSIIFSRVFCDLFGFSRNCFVFIRAPPHSLCPINVLEIAHCSWPILEERRRY